MDYTIEKEVISINRWSYLKVKRLFDILFGILGILILIPVSFVVLVINFFNKAINH